MSNSLLFASEFGIPTFCFSEFGNKSLEYLAYTKEFFKQTDVKIMDDQNMKISNLNKHLKYKTIEWHKILSKIINYD